MKVVVVLFESEVFGVFSNKDKAVNALQDFYEKNYKKDREGFDEDYLKAKFMENVEFSVNNVQ